MKSALTGKTEHRFPEAGGSYTVEGPWEPWNATYAAREEARRWLKAVGEIEKPLAQDAFENAMLELSYAGGLLRTGKVDAKARLRIYRAALADLPGLIVLAGLKEAIKTCKWFPSVSELREIMEPKAKELRLRIERARILAREPEPKPKLVAQILKGYGTLTEAQKAAHERRMRTLRAEMFEDNGKDRGPRPNYVPISDEEREAALKKLAGRG